MIIRNLNIYQNRNYLNGQCLSHFVWNHYNPDNKWRPGFNVHHKDGDTLNDHISNLELLTLSDHISLHHKGKKYSEDVKRKISEAMKGKVFTDEHKSKLSESHIGVKHSNETKNKMSLAKKGRKTKPFSEETRKKMSLAQKGNKNALGYRHSDEIKAKLSQMKKGFIVSEETKKKISETRKKLWTDRRTTNDCFKNNPHYYPNDIW